MANCYTCRKLLHGSWNIYVADSSFEQARKCLHTSDDYLFCTTSPNGMFYYCNGCWQKYVLALSSLVNAKQINASKEQNNRLRQQLNILYYELTSLRQKLTDSEQKCVAIQEHLGTSRAESTFYKNQLDGMNEKYNKISDTSGITQLRQFFEQLTSSQTATLRMHTNFRVDTFETEYSQQQLNCSSQFVTSTIKQLEASITKLLQIQKDTLAQRKQTKKHIFQMLISAGISKENIDASIKPLQIEIEQIQVDIKGWYKFLDMFIHDYKQRSILVLYLKQHV